MIDDFAVFILTHGRADNVITYRTLQKQGYTGKVYFIIDNEDAQAARYRQLYGDKVIMFDKIAIAKMFDEGDNFQDRRTILHARNASFGIAKQLGITYFVQLDDDYTQFRYRYDSELVYEHRNTVKSLDALFDIVLEYYRSIPALSIALGQGGDYIGGSNSTTGGHLWLKRKAMNSFFCSTKRPFFFRGRMNEDVNTYVQIGNRGGLLFSFFNVSLEQKTTQSNPGGITEAYKKYGTYVKSFYTIMHSPSSVKVATMHSSRERIHHEINWDKTVPRIVGESIRKSQTDSCRYCTGPLLDYPGENRVFCSAQCALNFWEQQQNADAIYTDEYLQNCIILG